MKAFASLALALVVATPSLLQAQQDTAHHRAVYAEIEKNAATYRRAKATWKDEPTVFQLDGWFDGATARKIVAMVPGEDGGGHEEYYYENGKPLFVFRTYRTSGAKPKRVEDRFYFTNGQLTKWLGTDRQPVSSDPAEFKAEADRLTSNAANFLAAFKGQPAAAAKGRTLTGTFLGIEQGDYAHWNLRTDAGEERSFFILRPDASVDKVVAKPKGFIGRKCRVTWKQSMENIPEAGGKIEVEQVLSVEWLK